MIFLHNICVNHENVRPESLWNLAGEAPAL